MLELRHWIFNVCQQSLYKKSEIILSIDHENFNRSKTLY